MRETNAASYRGKSAPLSRNVGVHHCLVPKGVARAAGEETAGDVFIYSSLVAVQIFPTLYGMDRRVSAVIVPTVSRPLEGVLQKSLRVVGNRPGC